MRRGIAAFLMSLLLLSAARAEDVTAAWTSVPEEIRPGQSVQLTYSLPEFGYASIDVVDEDGQVVLVLKERTMTGRIYWDGDGVAPGTYRLRLTCGDTVDEVTITVGTAVPVVTVLDAPEQITSSWTADLSCSVDGVLTVKLDNGQLLLTQAVEAGDVTVTWDGTVDGETLAGGEYTLLIQLTDAEGSASTTQVVDLTVTVPRPAHDAYEMTPDSISGITCGHENCYWNLPMGSLDEEAVWQVLTAPITVLDGNERRQYKVRKEPSADCKEYTGEVTYTTQAVHVLERGEEWTLIEAYSSSVEGSQVAVWAEQFTGYVETSLLKEVEVSQQYGIVIDKLQQRLYLYKEGKLFTTMLVSTGYPRSSTPYNETPAGEFVTSSAWTGGFWSGDLYCDMGMRINDGILLHEVPCTISQDADGNEVRDYTKCEAYLGEKASHGCIRIQKEKTPQNVNVKWLWDHLPHGKNSTPAKVIIWDEVGRVLAPADDDYVLYYNPDNGRQVHSDPNCALVNERFWPLTAFTYGQLEEAPYSKLKLCPGCAPQWRKTAIQQINEKNTRKVSLLTQSN